MTSVYNSTSQDNDDFGRPATFLLQHKRIVKILCISLVVLFTLAVTFQVCAIITSHETYSQIGCGIWCGVLYAATSVVGLFAVYSDTKAMTIGLLCMAATSVFTSLALMTLSALSLASMHETNTLWTTSNAILITVGLIGAFNSVTLLTIAAISFPSNKQPKHSSYNMEESGIVPAETEMSRTENQFPPSEVVAIIEPQTTESSSSAGSGIYESIKSKQGSLAESVSQAFTVDYVEPIYAVPVKKKKSAAPSIDGDFDIQVDTRCETEEKENNNISNGKWFNMEYPEEPVGSDVDDSQFTRNIELPKGDVIVHAPPSPN